MPRMNFRSAISDQESTEAAADALLAAVEGAADIDVAFLFFTGHHTLEMEAVAKRIWRELDAQVLMGCSAEGVIGGNREIERAPGMSLMVGESVGGSVESFYVGGEEWRELLTDLDSLQDRMSIGEQSVAVIAAGDPFSTPVGELFKALERMKPGLPLIGGMASAATQPGENLLIWNDDVYSDGMVGITLGGAIGVQSVVSQGCKPIGRPFVVTKAEENVIQQLGGHPALAALQEMVNDLPASEQKLLENGLMIGRAMSEYRDAFGRGDFLVRNLMGIDQKTGAIAVADYVRAGQTVQFHVRDAATATEDLSLMLAAEKIEPNPAAALLFSCNGRGTNLFDKPCHDIALTQARLKDIPTAGFFAAGELGPVGGTNFIHGHTASLALIRPRQST